MMRHICIVCEGQTETAFVNRCLVPHLIHYNVYPHARILQAPSGSHRGGRVSVERISKHISHEFSSYDRISTLTDLYGFEDGNNRTRAELEDAILTDVEQRTTQFDARFVLPYVQPYEFEALLFSNIEAFHWVLDAWNDTARSTLQSIRDAFNTPEDINDGPQTAPSKRISKCFRGAYSKTEHGPLIAEEIGLDVIRDQCPAFDGWIGALEQWGD